MKNNIVAIMYDFDKTLSVKDTLEYSFIPNLNLGVDEFWKETDEIRTKFKTDQVLGYMYMMRKKMLDNNMKLSREYLNEMGREIVFFPGVLDWFDRINEYGKSLGIEIEHYIISSGLKEIIEGSKIGDKFKCIYASEFFYNEDGNAIWPKLAVNYTNKTQFLIRINKGILDISDDNALNDKMLENDRRISTSNMIYIGEGYTDVPCMKLSKQNGGVSIAVYTDKNCNMAKKLLNDGRINYMVKSNYSEGSEIDQIVKKTIESMVINTELKNITYKQANE